MAPVGHISWQQRQATHAFRLISGRGCIVMALTGQTSRQMLQRMHFDASNSGLRETKPCAKPRKKVGRRRSPPEDFLKPAIGSSSHCAPTRSISDIEKGPPNLSAAALSSGMSIGLRYPMMTAAAISIASALFPAKTQPTLRGVPCEGPFPSIATIASRTWNSGRLTSKRSTIASAKCRLEGD